MKIIASRLSEGNKIFPAEIHIEEDGIKVKIPGFLSGDTKFINYENISAVDINTPMIGFSSITFFYQKNQAYAHGFKKEEVKLIKEAIDKGKVKAKMNRNHTITYNVVQVEQKPPVEKVVEIQPTITVSQNLPLIDTMNTKGSSNIYSEKLEKLIEFALSDGDLTEKEKQILFKKAEMEGIDLDEFEMVLDAKLHEKSKNVTSLQVTASKSEKLGDVKKCSACGAILQSFNTRCSDCGHDTGNVENTNSIKAFFREYQKIEDSIPFRENQEKTGLTGLMNMMNGSEEGRRNLNVFTRKKEFIMHFPVPNSKEDILEFLTLAVPSAMPAKKSAFSGLKRFHSTYGDVDRKDYDFLIAEVWMQKCEQIVMKARFAMKDDKKTLEVINVYANQLGIK